MGGKAVRFAAGLIAALSLVCAGGHAAVAEEFRSPSISVMRVDWRAAVDRLRTEINAHPAVASDFAFVQRRSLSRVDPRSLPALVQLNAVTAQLFAGISQSPVPVLLPFDPAAYLEAQASGAPGLSPARHQAGFRTDLFGTGPSGYNAVFSLEPGAGDGLPSRIFANPVEVQITGSLLVYDIADPAGGKGEPVKSLAAQYPDLRRFIREGYVRYAFTRFGVPYVVSIQCLDSVPKARRLACREAYPVAEHFLMALHVAGGQRTPPRPEVASEIAERPAERSPDFTYRRPGDIASSSYRKQIGRTDFVAYSQIRFPLEKAPAFIGSQSFGRRDKAELPGSVYPWRDNFCEARAFNVGQCESGFGHQGEDIRPAPCPAAQDGDERCDPKQQGVVAVRDAMAIRAPKQQALTLQVNTGTEHIRFRYMHMNPSAMDADGLINGRIVFEGEKVGVVSNYLDHPNGTSRHLHFDVQLFTRDGWIWVSPYVTLISAHERLIRGRGHEIGPEMAGAPPAVAHTLPEDALRPNPMEGGGGN